MSDTAILSNKFEAMKEQVIRAQERKNYIQRVIDKSKEEIKGLEKKQENIKLAKALIQQIAQDTQKELQIRISDLATAALESIFDDPYKVVLEFVSRRGKTEADIFLEKDGKRFVPREDEVSGGAVEVTALALQLTLWSLQNPRTRPTLILDEPLKSLKGGELPQKGAELIRELSEKLGVQIIAVSHNPELIESAHKVFQIKKDKEGVSHAI